jgi:hypothetical protein
MEKEELVFAENFKKDYPISFKRWIARAIESKEFSIREAKEKYSLTEDESTFRGWVERYGVGKELSLAMMTPEEKQEKVLLEKRIKELEKALEYAKLKNIAVETMIDVAEEQFRISIRKKAGPKQ